jgi:hypothetical protein
MKSMKNIVLLALIALAGCTAAEMPTNKSDIEDYKKIRTNGKFNGYSIEENDILEGRTHNANYKRLLISNEVATRLTKYAYDVGKNKNGKTYTLHIWKVKPTDKLYERIKHTFSSSKDDTDMLKNCNVFPKDYNSDNIDLCLVTCCSIHLNCNKVTLFDKNEAEEYLKEHPETGII